MNNEKLIFNWINKKYDKLLEDKKDKPEDEWVIEIMQENDQKTISLLITIASDELNINREDVSKVINKFFREKYIFNMNYIRERKIEYIKELYEDKLPSDVIDNIAKLFPTFSGTVVSNLVLDLYDSLVYNETPKGPNQ